MNEIITTALPALMEVTSKQEIESLAAWMVDEVLNNGKVLAMAEKMAATEHLIKAIKADKRYTEYIREELAKYSGKYQDNGTRIESAETGTRYDFTQCGDVILNDMLKEFERLDADIEERKKMLKTVPDSGLVLTDRESGETFQVYRPSKVSNSSYKVTLAAK